LPIVPPQRSRAELALSIGVLLLGLLAAVVAFRLPEAGGYARVGPNVVPQVVAGSLVLMGIWLLAEYVTGGWRAAVPDDPSERGEHDFSGKAFVWVTAGLVAQMALIQHAGFVIAGVVLFVCVARGFGSARSLRDLLVGAALTLLVYVFFVKFLNVGLPPGWLRPLLGGAGI
jgi:putative tricarboxylic transport membrane protein